MMTLKSSITMDVNPWPTGQGFQGANVWWEYVRNQRERDRLDFLFVAALTNSEICHLLLTHDQTLLAKFDLSKQTIDLLSQIQVNGLEEFAQAYILNVDWFSIE